MDEKKKRSKHRHFIATVDEDADQKTAMVSEVIDGKIVVQQIKQLKKEEEPHG